MSNERLRAAIASAGLTLEEVGDRVEVDAKTVERWISTGRVPHATNRFAVATLVGKCTEFLWPSTLSEARTRSVSEAEFVMIYPSRGAVPSSTWAALLADAHESIDILAFAASFLVDTVPDFIDTIAGCARSGVRVRLLFGDPASDAVRLRGEEEGIGDSLAGRCVLTWRYLRPLIATSGVQARTHRSTLYTSIFRFDDDLFANTHVYGSAANQSPVIHLHRIAGGRMFSDYLEGFERTWERAVEAGPDHVV
ncbi:DUF5919 domain-containing protein [Flexivirga alba]|uniref:DUF5919 domain-containing protein n=1 Tax=Flexivirga alba TaxID=702742 RepID=A0ABW2AIW4_9MICO